MPDKFWAKARHTQKILEELHPDLFSLENPKPFKIGLSNDLAAMFPEMEARVIGRLFFWLTRRRAYLKACVPGAVRYGFEGPCGEVIDTHADHAKALFKFRNKPKIQPPINRGEA